MHRLGVHFVIGECIPGPNDPLSTIELMAGLAAHKDARVRLALIPLLLQHPEFAIDAPKALELLDDSQKMIFKLYYTAAYLLQLAYKDKLIDFIATYQGIQDYFSEELDISEGGTAQDRLRQLAKRHQEFAKMAVNWYGTYQNTAERVLVRMQKERDWSKV